MSPVLRRPCPGCKVALITPPARRCAACSQAYERQRGSAVARGYRSPDWVALRALVLDRDELCTWGSLARDGASAFSCSSPSTDAAHVMSRQDGGQDTIENLRGLCHRHHSQETVQLDGGFGRARKTGVRGRNLQDLPPNRPLSADLSTQSAAAYLDVPGASADVSTDGGSA